ncbi:hypothetical protein FANTH_12864 [Fusarium anthophilum]|uniref:Uncharacterized protein n=1 Tax=Fusarium anthophilum TaxID=48485 RepID=A0A8H4YR02_9HYPO|nr:hypothetical protein FANTH_12864 [Fusarium anthophilum]
MATPWPQDEIWPTDYREHATNLSKYLQKALSAIDNGDGLPVTSRGVRVALIGALTLVVKMQSHQDRTTYLGTRPTPRPQLSPEQIAD